MLAPLDIFKMEDREYVWKVAAESLDAAKSKAEALGPGTYMIFSQTTGNKITFTINNSTEHIATVKS